MGSRRTWRGLSHLRLVVMVVLSLAYLTYLTFLVILAFICIICINLTLLVLHAIVLTLFRRRLRANHGVCEAHNCSSSFSACPILCRSLHARRGCLLSSHCIALSICG